MTDSITDSGTGNAFMPYKDRMKRIEHHTKWLREHPEVETTYQIKYSMTPKGRFKHLCAGAKARGILVGINQQQHEVLLALPCHWCGGALNKTGSALDRLDSHQGYVIGNVVPCCGDCNRAKGDLTVEEFKNLIRRIYERHV